MFCHIKDKSRFRNKKGFTFIELLVSIVLLVIVLSLIVSVMNGSVKTYEKSVSTSEAEILSNTIMQMVGDEVTWATEITSPTTGNIDDEMHYTSTNYGKGILKNTSSNRIAFLKDGETVPVGLINDASYSSGLSARVSYEAIAAEKDNEADIIKVYVTIMDKDGNEIRIDESEFQRINGWQLDSSESASLMNIVDPSKLIQNAIVTCSQDSDSGWGNHSLSINIDSNATDGTNRNLIINELEIQGIYLQQYGINYWCVSNYLKNSSSNKVDEIVVSWTDMDLSTCAGKYVRTMRYSFSTTSIGTTEPVAPGYSVGYVYCGNTENGYNIMAFPGNTKPDAPTGAGYLKHYMIGSESVGNPLELEEAYNIYRNLESTLTPAEAKAWDDEQI